jgi:hypothetical protein
VGFLTAPTVATLPSLRAARLPESNTLTSPVFINEFDAGIFNRLANFLAGALAAT